MADPLFTKRVTKSTNNKNSHERVTLEQRKWQKMAKLASTAGAMREATLSEMRVSFLCRDSSVADCVEEVVSCISQVSRCCTVFLLILHAVSYDFRVGNLIDAGNLPISLHFRDITVSGIRLRTTSGHLLRTTPTA